jgi:ankyrin repeat protein
MEFLFRHDVDLNATLRPNLFDGPIVVAAMEGHAAAVKWLLNRGASPNQSNEGYTYSRALSSACIWGHLECVTLLVEHGAFLNEGWDGKNALWFTEQYGHKEIAKYLRSKGAKLPEELSKEKPARKPQHKPKPRKKA